MTPQSAVATIISSAPIDPSVMTAISPPNATAGATRIVCITGSGTRPLDMLLTGADEVIALDANPAQNALLALKIAAIEALDRAGYLGFLGIAPSSTRGDVYDGLRQRLPADARDYWDGRRLAVLGGVWSAGQWERLLRWNGRFLSVFRRSAVRALFEAATIEEQAAVWQARFARGRISRAIETFGRDVVWRLVMREPAGDFLPTAREVGDRLARDFERASRTFLFRESDCATLALRGRHTADGALPAHLRAQNYERVRAGVERLRLVVGGLAEMAPINADGFSLSDFGSYCGGRDYAACWTGIVGAAAPGAKYCERIFMNEMPPPFPSITIDRAVSERLSALDKSIIYRVRAGTISR